MASKRLERTPLNKAVATLRPAIVTAVIFSFFINVLALASPLYMLQVYDRVLTSRNDFTLLFLTIAVIGMLLVYALLESLRTQVLVRGGLAFDAKMREPVFAGVLESTLKRQPGGSQLFRDMDQVRDFYTGGAMIAICDVPWMPVFLIAAFVLHPFFGILAIISSIVLFILAAANDRLTQAPLQAANQAAISAQNDAGATFRNSEVMKAMGMWGGLQKRWLTRRDDQVRLQALASDRGGAIMSGIKFFRQVVQTFVLGGGAYLVIHHDLSPGAMIGASIIVGRALAPVESGIGQWKSLIAARGAWDRLQLMFRANPSGVQRMSLPAPTGHVSVEAAAILPHGAKQPSLRGATFQIEPGVAVGIVGPSAAGKSSLLRGLVGVWPTVSGAIRIDGYELSQWDNQELGRFIGYLPQDIELFSGTVAENIARFGDVDSNEVIRAATLAGVHQMIQELPGGYDTQIGEGGAALSGGQRQRIALARAMYRMPALVVLDEPNASLDAAGEAALAEALVQLKKARCTVVFATHKPALLQSADRILVVQGGQVTQYADRDQLLPQLLGVRPAPTPVPGPGHAPAQAPQSADHQRAAG